MVAERLVEQLVEDVVQFLEVDFSLDGCVRRLVVVIGAANENENGQTFLDFSPVK